MLKKIFVLSALMLSGNVQARIYTVIDADGHVTISNKPTAAGKPFRLNDKLIKTSNSTTSNEAAEPVTGKFTYFYKYVDSDGTLYYTDKPKNGLTLLSKTKVKVHAMPLAGLMQAAYKPPPHRTFAFMNANKSRFKDLIEQTAAKHQVDVRLVHAVIQTESAYDSDAISPAGAVGLMQLMPQTAKRFGVEDRQAPEQNIEGGIRYLRHLMNLFPNDLDLAVAAYNAGENAVMRHNNSIPPYPETINYVKQVLALYNGR
ncbi:MAG: transglycosylase SLT domain-containing protein [Methylococcaceae bacterium]